MEEQDRLTERERLIARKEAEFAAREQQLEQTAQRRMRDNLYDRIPVSVGTMNIVIWVIAVLLAISLAVGIMGR